MAKYDTSALDKRMKEIDDPWYTPGDTQLDTAGLSVGSEYRPKMVDDGFDVPLATSERYKDNWANSATLDPEVISSLAEIPKEKLTEDEKAILKHVEDKNPSFKFNIPGYKVTAQWIKGGWVCKAESTEGEDTLSVRFGDVPKDDRERVMTRATKHFAPKKLWRELTPGELQQVARYASYGTLASVLQAATIYCQFALDDINYGIDDSATLQYSLDKYADLLDEAAWCVFQYSKIDLREEDLDDIATILAGRPATINNLFAAYDIFKRQKSQELLHNKKLFNSEPEPEPEPTYADFDSLSDAEIKELRNASLRERVNQRKQGY